MSIIKRNADVRVAIVTGEGVPVLAIIRAIAKCSCHQNSAKEKEPQLKRTEGKCTASKYSCKHSIIASHEKICFLCIFHITLMCWERNFLLSWFIYWKICIVKLHLTLNWRRTEDFAMSSIRKVRCQYRMWKEPGGVEAEFVGSDLYDGIIQYQPKRD